MPTWQAAVDRFHALTLAEQGARVHHVVLEDVMEDVVAAVAYASASTTDAAVAYASPSTTWWIRAVWHDVVARRGGAAPYASPGGPLSAGSQLSAGHEADDFVADFLDEIDGAWCEGGWQWCAVQRWLAARRVV
eukprot:SAG11_NODE_1068_length_5979_cov_9.282653_8_plen_134_part_00